MKSSGSETQRLRNLGPKSRAWLNAVGVSTRDDLERMGSVMTYKLVEQHGFAPSLNLLFALEGAIQDIHWATLPSEVKQKLKQAVQD